jgi:hypothetical protein
MNQTKANVNRLSVGQIYQGSSKPKPMHAKPTQRRITKLDISKDRIDWEPVEPIKKYDHKKRWMTFAGFFQWADILIDTPTNFRPDSDDGGGAIDGGGIGTGF